MNAGKNYMTDYINYINQWFSKEPSVNLHGHFGCHKTGGTLLAFRKQEAEIWT